MQIGRIKQLDIDIGLPAVTQPTEALLHKKIGHFLIKESMYASVLFFLVIFTPHVSDVSGVIVLTSSVCLSVCLTLTAERTDIRT